MRIAINAGHVRGAGATLVAQHLIAHMMRLDASLSIEAWLPRQWSDDFVLALPAERAVVHRVEPGIASKFVSENVRVRRALGRAGAQALLSLGDTSLPAPALPHVLLVQQAYLARPPEELAGLPLPRAFRAKLALMRAYFRSGLGTVSRFTVQTQHMKDNLQRVWDLAPERIEVVPSAIAPVPPPPADAPRRVAGRYLAYLANDAPHKNFEVLAPLLAALPHAHRDVRIALTVRPEQVPALVARAQRLGVLQRFAFLGPLPHAHALALLAGASAVVIPSRLESFGLTYFEAMALARPIVAADLDFAREPCGDAALYAAPGSGEAFADAVAQLLDDPVLAATLAERGRLRMAADALGWSGIAQRYLAILREVSTG